VRCRRQDDRQESVADWLTNTYKLKGVVIHWHANEYPGRDAGSASASEMLPAHCATNNAAVILWRKESYGKGSVQELQNLPMRGNKNYRAAGTVRRQNIDKRDQAWTMK